MNIATLKQNINGTEELKAADAELTHALGLGWKIIHIHYTKTWRYAVMENG